MECVSLVVDDEPMVRFLLVRFLEEEGHTVDEAADGMQTRWNILADAPTTC
jgi:DNA-binding response OmpR family regulator